MKPPAPLASNQHRRVLVLLALGLLGACRMQPQPEASHGPVRILAQLPTGISCVKVDELTLRDGIGCGQMGSSRPGQIETLDYNLRQQARKRQANVVIRNAPPRHDSWEGCHSNGLMAEASLYRCAFADEGATEP